MSHLEHDLLWSLARTELAEAEAQNARAHLSRCADCRVAFDDVKLAQQLLSVLPQVPPMPEQMARRVGASLAEAADARAAKSFTSWWQSLFTPGFILAGALGVVLVAVAAWLLASATPQPQAPVAIPTPSLPAPSPLPPAPVPLPVPNPAPVAVAVAAPAKKLSATVASAKKSTTGKAQVLAEGTTVSTQKGGSVWMKLPDGSRAGLTAASEVKLATLEEKQLTIELAHGSLAMVVPHREDRVLTVRAGELEVMDLGTRFLVSRDQQRTLVAVEEGKVQVTTPNGTREVLANHAVSWSNGQLTELAWETSSAPSSPVVRNALTPAPEQPINSIARLTEEDEEQDDAPPPEEAAEEELKDGPAPPPDRTPIAADEQWEPAPKSAQPQPLKYPPAPVKKTSSEKAFSLKNIERKLREAGTLITSPTGREAAARNITITADANDCHHARRLADRWLTDPVTGAANEKEMRRGVQLQQVRCLNHLGRTQDAETILKMIQAAH